MRRPHARRRRLAACAALFSSALLSGASAAADAFPDKVGYNCVGAKCVFNVGDFAQSRFADGLACMKACAASEIQSLDSRLTDVPTMTVNSSLQGTCTNCALVIGTRWNFPGMLDAYDLTAASLARPGCVFTSTVEINAPQLWVLEGNRSACFVNSAPVPCRRDGNRTLVNLSAATLGALAEPAPEYVFTVDSVSTRLGPGTKTDLTVLSVKFDGTNCRATTGTAATTTPRQVFRLELTSNSYKLVGTFSDTKMTASDPKVMSTTSVTMSFRSGAVLRAGAFILLRVAKTLEDTFSPLIRDVNSARLQYKGKETALGLVVGKSNISFTIPDAFEGDINNGDLLNITFANFRNPPNDSMAIEKGYLSAYQGLASAVDNSPILFYSVKQATRELVASRLDIASIVIFGMCFLVSLIIIRWHGLPLTMTTLWTDMVAISALFSFAAGCGGYVVWVVQPSKAYVHWYTAQYFFNTMMILSLCFHWASVLAFKSFKKLSYKSPAVIGFALANAAVLALIIVLSIVADSDLRCVFDQKALQCSSVAECTGSLSAEGRVVRDAVRECEIQSFYLVFGTGFVVCTVMLMVLGCMVMSKGRSLMLNEDPSEPRIRKSLTIFYAIIATTCVLYISAQVIYIAQYVSGRGSSGSSGELSDFVWYVFIIWLPHGLPPLLLLFLQWNPSTENFHHDEPESIDQGSKEDVFNLTPRSSSSSPHMPYSKLLRDRASMRESMINSDEPGNKLRLIVRLKLPANFDRACFVSLDFFSSKEPVSGNTSLAKICRTADWKCVGTTEPVGVAGETESAMSNGISSSIFPFVAVLEVPVVGHASNTLLRFLVHASTIGKRDTGHNFAQTYLEGQTGSFGNGGSSSRTETPSTQLSYQMTMFHPLLEFVTSSQAVLDAAASGQPLNVHPTDEHTCTILEEHPSLQREVDAMLQGDMNNAELSVQTVMMPGEVPSKDDVSSHKNIGNIIRFFQYDTEDGGGGLVVEDLQESVYSNAIPRQYMELVAVERQEQVEKAREDLHAFLNQKKDKQARGFYGTLIGQIQDEGDTAIAREWLESRLKKRKEYLAMVRKNIQYLVNRDKHKQYFKASVEKNSADLRFVPINLHIQDLLIGPTNSFINDEKRRSSKEVSVYDFTTVGAPAAHCYKFTKGGILSYQTKLKKLQSKLSGADLDISKWPEEIREYDDLQWDLQLRMDCAFAQSLAALTCSFVRKVEVAIQNPDVVKGEDILCQLSTLGFLFQVESLLSTHSKEIGMIEDMAGAVANLSCVAFVIQDVRDKPSNRFSFRMSRKKDVSDEAGIVKVTVSHKTKREGSRSTIHYIVTVQVVTAEVELPHRLASGGEIGVTPLLFTQGINEMQTIANNTERAKTELQDMVNINNLRPLKAFCEKYCRLSVALPTHTGNYVRGTHRYRNMNQAPLKMAEDQVTQEFRALEAAVLDAAQSLVKTKRSEILKRSSDLCRELGGGRVTVCKSAKDRTAMSVTLEQVRILHRHHDLPDNRIPATVSVMRSHGVRIENALKNTGKRQFAFNKLQRSLLPEEYRCPDQVGGTGNVS